MCLLLPIIYPFLRNPLLPINWRSNNQESIIPLESPSSSYSRLYSANSHSQMIRWSRSSSHSGTRSNIIKQIAMSLQYLRGWHIFYVTSMCSGSNLYKQILFSRVAGQVHQLEHAIPCSLISCSTNSCSLKHETKQMGGYNTFVLSILLALTGISSVNFNSSRILCVNWT